MSALSREAASRLLIHFKSIVSLLVLPKNFIVAVQRLLYVWSADRESHSEKAGCAYVAQKMHDCANHVEIWSRFQAKFATNVTRSCGDMKTWASNAI